MAFHSGPGLLSLSSVHQKSLWTLETQSKSSQSFLRRQQAGLSEGRSGTDITAVWLLGPQTHGKENESLLFKMKSHS